MKKIFILSVVALIFSVSIFIFFKSFYTTTLTDYTKEIIAGFLGAVITVVVTAVLLQAQSLSELRKEKSVGVFQAKLVCYTDFIDFLNGIVDDGIMDETETKTFRKWAMKLMLICGEDVSAHLDNFFAQTLTFKKFYWESLSREERDFFVSWYLKHCGEETCIDSDGECDGFIDVGSLIRELKVDLGEENVSDENGAFMAQLAINNMLTQVPR